MRSRGFTVVELVVVMVIMAILIGLAVVNVRSSQANARDEERKADAKAIAQALEQGDGWTSGSGGETISSDYKEYPQTLAFPGLSFPDLDENTLKAPGQTTQSLRAATSTSDTNPTINEYIYMPLHNGTILCQKYAYSGHVCRSFKLYYRTETDSQVHVIESKRQ